ncbi:inc metabolism membrane protein [Zygosaccharomyces mellis]|uniref:Inc metabolism membrane protein n=1 Tax=Zygosaccharomyces mellis TaxID=42258 RepID=A0A4C2EFG5_9SACH|nr:inc metabolism membrane protein [Zygosaccharomyces mellis]
MQSDAPVSILRPISFNPIQKLRRRVKSGSALLLNNKYCNAISNVIGRGHIGKNKTKEDDRDGHYNQSKREGDVKTNISESLLPQKAKDSCNHGRLKDTRSTTPNDSNISLFSDANTLVGSSSAVNTGKVDENGGSQLSWSVNLSPSSPTAYSNSVIGGSGVDESWYPDVKTFIRNFNHSAACELGRTCHLHYYQLPFPYRENKYIIHGYRFYASHKKSFLSIVNWYGWHNETSNIWTHLLGGVYLIYLTFYHFPHSNVWLSEQVPQPAKCIVVVFLAAAIKCMFASVFWHTFNSTHLLKLRSKFACVDYTGITTLITASILTVEFVTMYDYKISLLLYLTCSLALGFIGVSMNWSPKFDRPEARPLRIKFFILLAAVGCSSFVQLVLFTDWKYAAGLLTPVTNKSIVWYIIGVFFYGSFIPERFRTDVLTDSAIPTERQLSTDLNIVTKHRSIHFRETPTRHPRSQCCHHHASSFKSLWWVDYVGCSHTLWHFFVLLGVVGHYNAIMEMFTKRWML